MKLSPDQHIGHYRLIEEIGSGGMGIVWSALDTKLKRQVAIKILPPHLVKDQNRRLRFQREAETAASLSHPNIAVIYEVGEHDGSPYIVMELLKGKTLRDTVGRQALPPKDWLRYAQPIAAALAHAHKAGIIHRDLKSSNVMVTEDGHVKLLDFGLAKVLEPESLPDEVADVHSRLETISQELTRAGHVLGTVAYMSPEQARGGRVDHRSDIFSFGVLLYELATGHFPFSGNTDIESLSATLATDPKPLSEVVPDVPAEAERIVAKSLEKEPDRRYQHADDIVTDFRNLARDIDTGRVKMVGRETGVTDTVTGVAAARAASQGFRPLIVTAAVVVILIAVIIGLLRFRSSSEGDVAGVATTPANDAQERESAQSGVTPATERVKRVVVLPFENQGAAEDEFFALGVTEEIIGRLSAVSELAVISRSSAFQYDRAGKTMRQIGEDFDVDYILDGTVRWAKSGGASRVRISPQLVRVADDTGVWGERYDASMEDIFQVQTDIAGKVIAALDVVLVASERASVEAKPTENQEAYQAYLRGMDALSEAPMSQLPRQMLTRAVELDPKFYQAWAGLSRAHSWRYHGGDRASGQCEAAKNAADEALRLAPSSPEARMALGLYYYRCFRDYKRALAEVEVAGRDRPNDTDVLSWKATFYKRQGNLAEALRLHSRVLELDPMDFTAAGERGVVLKYMRELPQSAAAFKEAIAMAPDSPGFYYLIAQIYYAWKGTTEDARAALDAMPATPSWTFRSGRFWLEYYSGRYEDALAAIEDFPETIDDQTSIHPRTMMRALSLDAAGDRSAADEEWARAAEVLQRKIAESPEDFRPYSDLGPVLARLGRREEAIAAAKRAVELMPPGKDAEAAMVPADNFALIHVVLEDYDTAFDLVAERLEAIPGALTIPLIRLDPRWRGLVEHLKFEELAKRFGDSR